MFHKLQNNRSGSPTGQQKLDVSGFCCGSRASRIMSAFVCQPETFSTIYSGMMIYGGSQLFNFYTVKKNTERMIIDTLENLIARLYALNVQAVNQRYDEHSVDWMGNKAFEKYCQFSARVSMYQFLKSLECLQYQMCEGDIPQTVEYKELEDLINAVYRAIVQSSREYEAAQWG